MAQVLPVLETHVTQVIGSLKVWKICEKHIKNISEIKNKLCKVLDRKRVVC